MSSPKTAVRGNALGALAMLGAVLLTLTSEGILTYPILWAGLAVGTVLGYFAAVKVLMIQMPQMVAVFNGLGGGASALVGLILAFRGEGSNAFAAFTTGLAIVVGALTFSGSAVAAGKLHGLLKQRPVELPYHSTIVGIVIALTALALIPAPSMTVGLVQLCLALVFGILLTMRVGGADMPITISLLNSLSGAAGAVAGFPLKNPLLVAVGGIVGASGLILTQIMCRAMNRSLISILTGRTTVRSRELPAVPQADKETSEAPAHQVGTTWQEALQTAERVVIIPGYGLALSQAQWKLKELIDLLEAQGRQVKIGIHPVAGRMPGHMNVLLAEADVSYDHLHELEDTNEMLPETDVAIVIGANDVVNPAAIEQPNTPIYGMPIIRADLAKHVLVLNYDTNPGYAGVPNPLYDAEHASLLLGDAKESLEAVIAWLKSREEPTVDAAASLEQEAETFRAARMLAGAQSVIIVPGYGMALASAQLQVKQIADCLQERGADVKIAIHPVAGRMPGHMNVLLAEVDIPYDLLYDLDVINDQFGSTDVALVVGANDVVNPSAQTAEGTPIYGMPVLNVHEARQVVVCNLDRSPGYAGVPNSLYDMPHCLFVPGSASQTLADILTALRQFI